MEGFPHFTSPNLGLPRDSTSRHGEPRQEHQISLTVGSTNSTRERKQPQTNAVEMDHIVRSPRASVLIDDLENLAAYPPPIPITHKEEHSKHGEVVHDFIIGFADGLTVPFALTAGLSSLGSARVVQLAGMAELVAGSLSMGLGAYLAASTDADKYAAEEAREYREIVAVPEEEKEEIYEVLGEYMVSRRAIKPFVDGLVKNKDMWVKFMMDFELCLPKPNTSRAWISGVTMGSAYFLGGIIPLIPYFATHHVNKALFISIGVTVVILLGFGYIKAILSGCSKVIGIKSALHTLIVGALAAGASYGIVKGINTASPEAGL
ncbi:MAG: hypothetical protein M1812_003256 [Candelaria pacifica]|nr:MAG: hypothetical protein M1812_003256 [Candelaria pacifica]